MLQNLGSLAESAHDKTEASVSGHYLDSSGKSMKWVTKRGNFCKSEKNATWNIFVDLELDLDFFCPRKGTRRGISDLEIFCPNRRGKRNWTWNNFVPESKREKGSWIFCPSKREKKSKVKQVRSEASCPLSGKETYGWVPFPDQFQNNSMLPFHATNKKSASTQLVSSRSH